jgi:signal transduction histidine kinase
MAKLKPRARIIRTIGDQLISGPEAALIELVKNSYDADASWIEIKIAPICEEFPTGIVRVKDNGHGMTRAEVERSWFEPATDGKKFQRLSRSGTRTMLGAKGIGRFASARLGAISNIISIAKLEKISTCEQTSLTIDWRVFESEIYLDQLDIPIESILVEECPIANTGVTIEISLTRITWTEKNVEKLINELRRLVSPKDMQGEFNIFLDLSSFKKNKTQELSQRSGSQAPSGFDGRELLREALLEGGDTDTKIISREDADLIIPYRVQDQADYVLVGNFSSDGEFRGYFVIERGDNVRQDIFIPASPLAAGEEHCGEFSIRIQIYDRETDAIEALFGRMGLDFKRFGVRRARQLLNENSGIGVYRDAFRVRPYGEAENDWLMLESRRVQEPSKRIGHTQTSGQVLIESEINSNLVERSSREGFEHNGSFDRLKQLITTALVRAEEKRFDYRQNAGLSRKLLGDVEQVKEQANLQKLVMAANKLPDAYRQTFIDKIEKESAALTKSLNEIDAYQKLLESRSALGLVVARVIHDGRRYLEPMSYAAISLIDGREYLFEQTTKGDVIRKYYPVHAETISTGVKGLNALFKALDPVSGRKRGRPQDFVVSEVVETATEFMTEFLIENNISVEIDVDKSAHVYGFKGDMQSALLNILDNAIHWLSTVVQDRRIINISWQMAARGYALFISNNGPLIDNSYSAKLFDAGFTLKSEGHGLGLVIAREACRASKGELYFDESATDTTFVIEFPRGEKK